MILCLARWLDCPRLHQGYSTGRRDAYVCDEDYGLLLQPLLVSLLQRQPGRLRPPCNNSFWWRQSLAQLKRSNQRPVNIKCAINMRVYMMQRCCVQQGLDVVVQHGRSRTYSAACAFGADAKNATIAAAAKPRKTHIRCKNGRRSSRMPRSGGEHDCGTNPVTWSAGAEWQQQATHCRLILLALQFKDLVGGKSTAFCLNVRQGDHRVARGWDIIQTPFTRTSLQMAVVQDHIL